MVLWFEMQNAAARSPGHATTVCFMYLNVYRCMYQTEQCMYARMVFSSASQVRCAVDVKWSEPGMRWV
jgi:hypothetical protein